MGEIDMSQTENDEILDARMEYGHLVSSFMSLVSMFWVGYGAFFTLNSLLAAGLSYSYSESWKSFDKAFLAFIHYLIPCVGIFMSAVAIYAALMLVKMQRAICVRGIDLETRLLHAQIFHGLKPYSHRFPSATVIGSALFGLLWAGSFLIARM
jgi:hypothetical protein